MQKSLSWLTALSTMTLVLTLVGFGYLFYTFTGHEDAIEYADATGMQMMPD